jgi:hypothetical protein
MLFKCSLMLHRMRKLTNSDICKLTLSFDVDAFQMLRMREHFKYVLRQSNEHGLYCVHLGFAHVDQCNIVLRN